MIPFTTIINTQFLDLCTDTALVPIDKKHVLSLINGYEDGKWRADIFQRFIWNNIAESALSFKERNSLVGDPATMLAESAKNLRLTDKENDIGKGSELAEIILYGIMKYHYGALPVVPKIFYKQNRQDNAKGSDSVHIVVNGSDFSLWFGEAKFYNSIEDARLYEIITSIGISLLTEKLKKENSIITNVSDIDDLITDLNQCNAIKQALSSQESIDSIKPKLHIPILLIHECDFTKKAIGINENYRKELISFYEERVNSYFKKQIKKLKDTIHLYNEISFHIILIPVPDKDSIINQFIISANFHSNQ